MLIFTPLMPDREAVGATGLAGQDGTLLGAAIWQSLLMLGMVCVLTWLQSGLLSFML